MTKEIYLHRVLHQPALNTKVKTGLPFGHKMDARAARLSTGDQSGLDSGSAHLRLLRAPPAVWMGEDEFEVFVLFQRCPGISAHKEVSLLNVSPSTGIEIFHKISEQVDDGFVFRKRTREYFFRAI
jgi:hypothetical protein